MSDGARGLDPVWRHAPGVLLRYRALFAAVAFGAMLLALAVAAYPLFLAATSSSLVRAAIERENITRYAAGMTYRFTNMPLRPKPLEGKTVSADPEDISPAFARLATGAEILGDPVEMVLDDTVAVSRPGDDEWRNARLFSGTGVLDHVELLRGDDGDGVWMPDLVADALHLRPGDVARLTDQNGRSVQVSIDGVYRAVYTIYTGPSDGYWFPWQAEFATPCADCSPPAQPILGSRSQVLELARDLHHDSATMTWNAPIDDPSAVSLRQIEELQRYVRQVVARVSDPSTPLGELFDCCQTWFFFGRTGTDLTSDIGFAITDARQRIAAVEGPTKVLEIAGIAVALSVVAAAGAFSVRARRVEAAWLFARGASTFSVGVKSALESALPLVVGGLAGLALAWGAVEVFGPGAPVARSALVDATLATGLATVSAALLLALVAAVTYVRVVDPHGRRFAHLLQRVPWELGVAALAFVALRRLEEGGAFVKDPSTGIVAPSLALVAFPFLFLAAFATLAARIARMAFSWLRRPTTRAGSATYLASRRLAGAGSFAMLLVAAAGLCLGTFLHAQVVSRSLRTTVDAKAGVFVGSDVQGRIDYQTPIPDAFGVPTTRVVRYPSGVRLVTGRSFDLLAVDAGTFAEAAFWDDAFAEAPLPTLLRALTSPSDDRLPIVLAGAGELPVDRLEIATTELPVDVVARTIAFPGMSSLNPLVVVDSRTLLRLADLPFDPLHNATASTELWVRGPTDAALASLTELEFPPSTTLTAEEVKDLSYIAAAIETFVVVNVLGLVAAALVFVGMLMYLQARQRSQIVSFALSTRMGMSHRQHRRALMLELAVMLLWGLVVGSVLALIAAGLTVPILDPIPTVPPDPIFVVPVVVFGATTAITGALAWIGAAATDRRARGIDLGEVMRVAE